MPNDQIRIIKKADVETRVPDMAKMLREAASQVVGQADRTNNLFVEVLCDVVNSHKALEARIEMLEAERETR